MYVQYTCEECGADVNSNMEVCPKCGAELPEYTLERDYDAEIDEELYELEHPIRTKLRKLTNPYFNHLWGVVEEEIELDESVDKRAEEIMNEKGVAARRWYKVKRKLWMILFAIFLVVFWLLAVVVVADFLGLSEDSEYFWLWLVIPLLLPLYLISLWLLVSQDKRELPLKQVIRQSLWGAFNKLVFAIIYVGGALLIITTVNRYLFSFWE